MNLAPELVDPNTAILLLIGSVERAVVMEGDKGVLLIGIVERAVVILTRLQVR